MPELEQMRVSRAIRFIALQTVLEKDKDGDGNMMMMSFVSVGDIEMEVRCCRANDNSRHT